MMKLTIGAWRLKELPLMRQPPLPRTTCAVYQMPRFLHRLYHTCERLSEVL